MDVDMRAFLTESLGYDSCTLNESSNTSGKDNRKFSDKLNDILAPILRKMRELFERFKTKFTSIINKILTKLGLNPVKDLKTFKEALYSGSLPEESMPVVEKLVYSFELVDNFRIIDKVADMYTKAMNDIKLCYDNKDIADLLSDYPYTTLFGVNSSTRYEFSWENIDNWGEMMRKVTTPISEECSAKWLYLKETIYSPDVFDEILRRGKSEYINSINSKVLSIKANINGIIDDGKNELKSLIKNDKELEKVTLERVSKLASTIPPVMLAVTNGIMGAAAESCRRAVILANAINKLNRDNGYGDIVNISDEKDEVVAVSSSKSSASFSKLMR